MLFLFRLNDNEFKSYYSHIDSISGLKGNMKYNYGFDLDYFREMKKIFSYYQLNLKLTRQDEISENEY